MITSVREHLPLRPEFSTRLRARLRDAFGIAQLAMHARPAFAGLSQGPWALLWAIAAHWQLEEECWPSQQRLAALVHVDAERSVRRWTSILQRAGFLDLRRERRRDGSERIFYAPGPVFLSELGTWVDSPMVSLPRPKTLGRSVAHPPDAGSVTVSAPQSGEPGSQEKQPSFLAQSLPVVPVGSSSTEEKKPIAGGDVLVERARGALAARRVRRHPGRHLSVTATRQEIALVVACAAALDGSGEARRLALRDALEGAWETSSGPPSVKFIFGSVEHFLSHEARGRTARERSVRAAHTRPLRRVDPEPVASPAEVAKIAAAVLERL